VISNCVINLSPEKLKVFAEIERVLKPGGRVVISDIVSETPLPPEIRFNPRLKGECIAGAMTAKKLLATLSKLGLAGVEVLRQSPWRTVDEVSFDTMTVRAYKPAAGSPILLPSDDGPGVQGVAPDFWLASQRFLTPPFGAPSPSLERGIGGEELHAGRDHKKSATPGVQTPTATTRAPRHAQDCMVCGAPLVYLDHEAELKCHYCGQAMPANAHCAEGHFVCDACHAGDHIGFIKAYCRSTAAADPIAIFSAMRRSSASGGFPLHGPEHHALVPAAFLTAYRNSFGEPPPPRLEAAIDRGAALPGGTCAYWGGCAAALGIGIAYATILRATPLSHEPRGVVQTVVSRILAEMGRFGKPRCCRRESYLALQLGSELSSDYLPHRLECGAIPPCDQMALNHECIGVECPFHAASG